jgi:hypothetical protein
MRKKMTHPISKNALGKVFHLRQPTRGHDTEKVADIKILSIKNPDSPLR